MSYGFIFPGQGSQSVGMMADLAQNFPIVKTLYEEASHILGYDLWQIVQEGPESKLNQTHITQPALLTAGYAAYKVLASEVEAHPAYMAGHSLGEYTALVAAESINFAQGVELVAERGRLMELAVDEGEGAMAAVIGLEDEKVAEICQQVAGIVEPANFNSPGQVVIAGYKEAVEKAIPLMQEAGAKKVVMLAVSVPSHCSLMDDAATIFANAVEAVNFKMGNIDVLHNVDAKKAVDVADMKAKLVAQLHKPVLWTGTVKTMHTMGVEKLIESGPGKVLAGLTRRIEKSLTANAVLDSASVLATLEEIK